MPHLRLKALLSQFGTVMKTGTARMSLGLPQATENKQVVAMESTTYANKTLLTTGANGRPGDTHPPDVFGWGAGKLSAMNSVNPTPVVNPPIPIVASPSIEEWPDDLPQPLLEQFLGTKFGQIYYDVAEKYFREIMPLIPPITTTEQPL